MSFSPLTPGPWQHLHVAANGARFHLASAGPTDGTPVLLLHGFPQFWWAWRHQLTGLAERGHRVLAMDLRGYGASDKTPEGYDPITLANDVGGVIAALGLGPVHLVGHGWGGYIAWTVSTLHHARVASLTAISAPHPLSMLRRFWRGGPALRHVLAMQVPWFPERRLRAGRGTMLADHLRGWAAPGSSWPSADEVSRYQSALALWPAPHCALEYHRWMFRSRFRADGRAYSEAMRTPVKVRTHLVLGGADPVVRRPWADTSARHVSGDFHATTLAGVGHFPPEEAPDAVTHLIDEWTRTN